MMLRDMSNILGKQYHMPFPWGEGAIMANVSRRSFVELVTGTLVSLPTLAGGVILAPRPAYGDPDPTDDSEIAGLESEYVIIDIVRAWETGFMVVDITKPEKLGSRWRRMAGAPDAESWVTFSLDTIRESTYN